MATNPKTIFVKIRKEEGNPLRCLADDFKAQEGDTVDFQFEEGDADIEFSGGSPFKETKFKPGRQTVRSGAARPKRYEYTITWANGGRGSGGGLVEHSR